MQRLLKLGKQRALGTDDLRKELPIDEMSLEEIIGIIRRLEDAGVEIDVDPGALGVSRANTVPVDLGSMPVPPPPITTTETSREPTVGRLRETKLSVGDPASAGKPNRSRPVTVSILVAAVITFGLLLWAALVRGL